VRTEKKLSVGVLHIGTPSIRNKLPIRAWESNGSDGKMASIKIIGCEFTGRKKYPRIGTDLLYKTSARQRFTIDPMNQRADKDTGGD
jgi:hypothetical protein